RPGPVNFAQRAVQRRPIPVTEIRSRLVRALQECHESALGVRRRTHCGVWQNEFTQLLGKESLFRARGGGGEALGRRVGVGIERRIGHWSATAWPEPRARYLMRIGFARDGIRQVRHTAWVRWCASSGEACYGKIETAPEKMHRAHLAKKTGAEVREHVVRG